MHARGRVCGKAGDEIGGTLHPCPTCVAPLWICVRWRWAMRVGCALSVRLRFLDVGPSTVISLLTLSSVKAQLVHTHHNHRLIEVYPRTVGCINDFKRKYFQTSSSAILAFRRVPSERTKRSHTHDTLSAIGCRYTSSAPRLPNSSHLITINTTCIPLTLSFKIAIMFRATHPMMIATKCGLIVGCGSPAAARMPS